MFEFLPYLFLALVFGCGYVMGMLHMLIWTPSFMKQSARLQAAPKDGIGSQTAIPMKTRALSERQ